MNKPGTYSVDDLIRKYPPEERVYRMRCVEHRWWWCPGSGFRWQGYGGTLAPLTRPNTCASLLSLTRRTRPGSRAPGFPPDVEGLRLDEAMNDLTLLVTGIYGKPLPPQEGAPIRMVVPWKYGFKGIKAIVKIDLVEEMPVSFWMTNSPDEYGFYSNVNPDVPHPRWAQDSERRLGELNRVPT